MHYPYSDPSDRFADCRYSDDEPMLARVICPICKDWIEVGAEKVKIDGCVKYHKECFEGDLWDLLLEFGIELCVIPDEY